jgi:DNA-binding CsgD family transcriptional regulator
MTEASIEGLQRENAELREQLDRLRKLLDGAVESIWEMVKIAEGETAKHSLTPRELEVLEWAAQGKTAREIGKILMITKRTVDEHIQTAVRKLGAANKSHAVAVALRLLMIEIKIPAPARRPQRSRRTRRGPSHPSTRPGRDPR